MSREYNESCCWTIEKFSFFHNYFAIIDTADYLADQLFFKHQVRVGFGPEFVCPDAPYRVIMCKCRKRDVDAFLAAIRELPNKMLLCGYPDYLTFCADLKKKVQTVRDNEVFSPMKQMIPLKKQSKKAQKKQHAKQRGSWYGICPITRTVPNGKAYDRNRIKREDREFAD